MEKVHLRRRRNTKMSNSDLGKGEASKVSRSISEIQEFIFLAAMVGFLAVSVLSLGSILMDTSQLALMLGLGVLTFVLAVICYGVSPTGHARWMKLFFENADKLARKLEPEDIPMLQRSVGSAGYFNRIGLTGIPMAVALMAVLLCVLVFVATYLGHAYQDEGYTAAAGVFRELTKLTIGAFIGALR